MCYAARLPYELALIAHKQRRFADAQRHLELAREVGDFARFTHIWSPG
jgi:hypothetical protein